MIYFRHATEDRMIRLLSLALAALLGLTSLAAAQCDDGPPPPPASGEKASS